MRQYQSTTSIVRSMDCHAPSRPRWRPFRAKSHIWKRTLRWCAIGPRGCRRGDALRVGLCWAGQARPWLAGLRCARPPPQHQFGYVGAARHCANVRFISLQKGPAAAETRAAGFDLLDVMDDVTDFADTAAIVANLDLVISVDTSIVHLAGAMGKPVFLLDRYDNCWRWLSGREDSPWYPTLRIFRQQRSGEWAPVIAPRRYGTRCSGEPSIPLAGNTEMPHDAGCEIDRREPVRCEIRQRRSPRHRSATWVTARIARGRRAGRSPADPACPSAAWRRAIVPARRTRSPAIGLQRHGEGQTVVRRLTHGREIGRVEHLPGPRLRRQEVAEPVAPVLGIRMQIDQARIAAGHCDHVVRVATGLQAGGDQLGLDVDNAGHRFVAMIGADDQQDVVAGRASRDPPRRSPCRRYGPRRAARRDVPASLAELVLGVIGFAQPQHGERRAAVRPAHRR